ncbi:AT-rich interaction domain 6 [Anabas testudineus]|uniref:AT-rich interaction domain 6 n=1 Tax=Anabas testudineus TaxID=64144 RepID=UPI000E4636FF|nr:AT-rich interaction domain 6 [Anabas testudineus]
MEMAHGEIREERAKDPVEEVTEERFLKDLYLFMKKRDTPIERIPHLGFKQIDLFVMFKTVRDLGGYHQVTAQQLWKQVYNTLGGNPRSTSAATCTRRHYEKLLLPYECQVKGILMNALPRQQPKALHYPNFIKDDDDDGQRPAKRKLISMPLHQNPFNHLPDPHGNVFPLPLHCSHYYHPSHTVLPPYVPISPSVLTSHSPPAPKPQFTFHPSFSTSTQADKGPLEYLRGLADKYKHLAGLAEPLNLSTKASSQETNKNTASSFSPPSLSKNPKFLNKPSPLYTLHQVARNGETQDGEAAVEVKPYLYPAEEKDAYIIDDNSASSSPTYDCCPTLRKDEGTSGMAQKPSTPKTDFTIWPREEGEGSPEVRRLNLSHIVPNLPRDNGGKMEIEIPLSVLHKWLKLCQAEPSTAMPGAMQVTALSTNKEHTEQKSPTHTDVFSMSMPSHMNPQHQSSAPEDLRLRPRHGPSPTTTNQTPSHPNTGQNHFSRYKPLPSGGILKNASSRDVYPLEQQDTYKSEPQSHWSPYDKELQALKTGYGPVTGQQDFTVTKPYTEDIPKGGNERSEVGPSAVLMVDSSPGPLLQLTTEEVMKLKKIISRSL